ncbi:MAG: hypothetical protein ACU0C9_09145 [Paracoccaceae bacterium]
MPRTYMEHLKSVRPDQLPPLGYRQDITILVDHGATASRDAQPNADGIISVVELL